MFLKETWKQWLDWMTEDAFSPFTQSYSGLAGDSQHLRNRVWKKVRAGTAFRAPVWQDYVAFIDEGYILAYQDHLRFYSMSYMLEVNKKADFEGQVSGCKSFSYTNPRWFNWTLPAATRFPDILNSSLDFPDHYLPFVPLRTSLCSSLQPYKLM